MYLFSSSFNDYNINGVFTMEIFKKRPFFNALETLLLVSFPWVYKIVKKRLG